MRLIFLMVAGAGTAFIWLSGQDLPAIVPSHFNANGVVNGHMPRHAYLVFVSAITLIAPAIVVFAPGAAIRAPGARVNLPNRDYWMAPDRRARTIGMIDNYFAVFGIGLVGFLCFTHYQVVRAVAADPMRMDMAWMNLGLGVFLGFLVVWMFAFIARFARRD